MDDVSAMFAALQATGSNLCNITTCQFATSAKCNFGDKGFSCRPVLYYKANRDFEAACVHESVCFTSADSNQNHIVQSLM